ncbi:MAG: N-acetylmuramoyl-L-alanine amidase [Pseudomonadota bacterium]
MAVIHLIFVLLASVFLVSSTGTAIAQDADLPVAFNAKIAGDDATTRFFLDFDKNLSIKTFYMDEPYRIIIDLEEAVFNFADDSKPEARGLIEAVQFGRISKGRSRIVLTLSAPAEIIKSSMQKRLDEENFRFLMDLDSTDESTFASLLDTQSKELGESGGIAIKGDRIKPVQKEPGRFTVVLDPGHGGIDGGATGRNGLKEKDIVLQVARKLAKAIEKAGPYDVLMTREEDTFVSLRHRLEFSRRSKADLFISVHADSLRQRYVRGATVYTLSKRASDRLSAELAASENSVDLLAGLPVDQDVEEVTDILADLTAQETKKFSRTFSNFLVTNLKDETFLNKNPQRSAAFAVLKAPDVPSVLLELGYLSNAQDENLMQQAEWQNDVTNAVSRAVDGFFSLRKNN